MAAHRLFFTPNSNLTLILRTCLPIVQSGIIVVYVFSSFMSHEKKYSVHSSVARCFVTAAVMLSGGSSSVIPSVSQTVSKVMLKAVI